jgi:hypothetical protein
LFASSKQELPEQAAEVVMVQAGLMEGLQRSAGKRCRLEPEA